MEGLLRSLWGVLGVIFRSCPLTSQKLPLCGNQQTERISGQLLRSLLQNPRNFSEVAPEVRPAVHTALLCLTSVTFDRVCEAKFRGDSPVHMTLLALKSRTKIQPKEEVFGTDIPQSSGGHSRAYPGPKLRSGSPNPGKKNKHFAADIHDPKARTSTTLRDFQKLCSEKLWAKFSFSIKGHFESDTWTPWALFPLRDPNLLKQAHI